MTRSSTTAPRRVAPESLDEAFIARAFEASTWASRNRQKVAVGTAALLIVILGLIWYAHYRSTVADNAIVELTRVRATVQSGNTQLAISDLEKYLDRFGGTKNANEARLMLGQQELIAGQADKAVKAIEPAAGRESTADGAQASFILAQAYEASKSTEKAEQTYMSIGDKAPFLYMKQDALDNVARLRMQRGDANGAAEVLQKLIDLTPETAPERDVFQLRLGEALAAAGKPVPAEVSK